MVSLERDERYRTTRPPGSARRGAIERLARCRRPESEPFDERLHLLGGEFRGVQVQQLLAAGDREGAGTVLQHRDVCLQQVVDGAFDPPCSYPAATRSSRHASGDTAPTSTSR